MLAWPRAFTAASIRFAWDNWIPLEVVLLEGTQMSLSAGKIKHMKALSNSAGVIACRGDGPARKSGEVDCFRQRDSAKRQSPIR